MKHTAVISRAIGFAGLFLSFALSGVFAQAADSKKANAPLPLESFYQSALISNVQLSPDGTHILALRNVGGDTVVMTINLKTGEKFYPAKTDNKEFKFNWVSWANNDRILMSLRFDSRYYARIKYTQTRLLAMDAKKPSKMITLSKPDDDADGWVSQYQDNVISMLPDDPDHILLSVDRELPLHQTVYKVNVNNGHLKTVQKAKSSVRDWYADQSGTVRAGYYYDERDGTVAIKVLDPTNEHKRWVTAWEYKALEDPSVGVLGFGDEGRSIYLTADYQGRQAIYKSDLTKPDHPMELLLSDPDYDVDGSLIYSPSYKDPVGLYYSDDSDRSVYWNAEFKAFQAGLDKVMPDTNNYIASMSADARKYVVFVTNATNPGAYMLGDRDAKSISPLAVSYPQLANGVLVEKELRTYKTRDGLTLEGYLSLPKNYKGSPVATIILPHGGPMSQDGKGYDRYSAFLVNSGYAVFQPNFRGSSGYGHDFMMMAVGGMGLAMQDDLEDAVKYLVAEKIADSKRVCIVGGSYGGYAALMGATKTPDLFQCAISIAGISDILKLRDKARYYLNRKVVRDQLGNDNGQLKQTSPRRLAERVKIPILLIHGDDDTIVPVEQSRLMAKALKKYDKTYEYIELEGGSHYLDYLPNRQQAFEAMDSFLHKYLPVDAAPAKTEAQHATL